MQSRSSSLWRPSSLCSWAQCSSCGTERRPRSTHIGERPMRPVGRPRSSSSKPTAKRQPRRNARPGRDKKASPPNRSGVRPPNSGPRPETCGRVPRNSIPTHPPNGKRQQGSDMAATNRARNDLQRAKGKVKEAAGDVTGDRRLARKGQADQVKGKAKNVGEKAKDKLQGR